MIKVVDFLNHYRSQFSGDPRPVLDQKYWNLLLSSTTFYSELDAWCEESFDPDSWVRIFNKIWFTDQRQYTMFSLSWSDNVQFLEDQNEF